MALSWSLGDDIATAKTVPIARSAIQMTITNNSINAGAKAWQIIGGVPTLLGTATQDGTITVSFTNDPIVVAANFAIVAAPPTVAVTVLPPSSIKMIARPRISRGDSFITCNAGEYRFIRNGSSTESLTATAQISRLLSNGLIVDSSTAISQLAQFSKSEAYENSTLSCEAVISQEGVTSSQSSIDNDSIKLLESAKVKQISQANYDYYKARDNAYLNRIEGNATSAATWKKALEKAISAREAQKVKASSDFIASLEEAGISILYITKVKEVTPEPALPVIEKELPVTNVQPSKAMKKIGTIYFATGTYFINDASKKVLKELAAVIADSGPSKLLSYGHTDSKGGTDNLLLSQNRAKAVARFIRSLLPDQLIKTGWYAASKPISSGNSKADLAKNRRVEIYMQ
jgi:outer membrane protein OmpA-like peptidoglycan-associated protein